MSDVHLPKRPGALLRMAALFCVCTRQPETGTPVGCAIRQHRRARVCFCSERRIASRLRANRLS